LPVWRRLGSGTASAAGFGAHDRIDPTSLIDTSRMTVQRSTEGLAIAMLRNGRPSEAFELVGPGATALRPMASSVAGIALNELGQFERARQELDETASDRAASAGRS
jgi:hypothetical protein